MHQTLQQHNNTRCIGLDEQERTIVIFGTHDLFLSVYCYCYYATPALFKSNKQYPYLIHYVVYCDVCVVSVLVQSGVAIEPWMDGNAGNAGIVPVGG